MFLRLVTGDTLRKKLQGLSPTVGRKGTSPAAGLGETLQHATELMLNGVVAVAAYDTIGTALSAGRAFSIAQPVPTKRMIS